ncbi:MAG: hypothetical protein RI894_1204, partial [Bacteroidota bacterium]
MKKTLLSLLLSIVCVAFSFGQTRMVTFQVSSPDSLPVYVFGSWNWGGWPGTPMTSVGGGFYTATLPLAENTVHEYLFVNGTTGSVWQPAKEVLDPAWACTNGNATYTNRVLNLGAADMTVCNDWASCNTCTVPGGAVQITFEVQSPVGTPVYIFGSWSNWGNWPGDGMTPIGNGKYSITLPLASATPYEYLFVTGATPVKEALDPAAPCTNGNLQYTNRTLVTGMTSQTLCNEWATCNTCQAVVQSPVDLPLTFADPLMNYGLTDFGNTNSSVVADPTNATNMVAKTIKTAGAATWAGTTVGGTVGFANPIPIAIGATHMTLRVWSPDAGIPVMIKIEDPNDATHSVETLANTTVAGQWETLVFNFANQRPGTAAINYAYNFKKASVFFNFNTSPSADKTYYWDDMIFTGTPPPPMVELPVTFDDPMVDYNISDFGGNNTNIIIDPTNAANMVGESTKSIGANTWAGTTLGGTVGFGHAVQFAANRLTMTMRVWSPDAGIVVRLKVEEQLNGGNFIETDATTTMAGAWETLTFNFANPASAPFNPAFVYKKASVFFNFGVVPAADKTYYWDDMMLLPAPPAVVDLPVTFDNAAINYGLTDFGNANSSIVADPTMPTNMVGKTIKAAGAATWAGTTVGAAVGFANPVPFAPGMTAMTLRVWSPDAGTVVRLKVEDANDASRFVETDATTTAAGQWETLVFNYPNYNPAYVYKKASVFFAFGTSPSADKTYYWDDMIFAGPPPAPPVTLPLTFTDPAINYGLTDFGGTNSSIVADPNMPTNMVGK